VASRAKPEDSLPFELRPSPIAGLGAFATRPIRKGTRIIEYTGERISNAEADRRYDEDKMRRHHTFLFTLNRRTVVDAAVGGNEARFINHSCAPNCEAVIVDGKRIFIEAIKDIPVGVELVYDYQYERTDDHTPEDERFYTCSCGAPECRGTILAPKKKPAKRRKKQKSSQAPKR
jgi:SET domain-containing protein